MSEGMSEVGFERTCERCGRGINDLEPAAVLSFGGAVQTDELLVCVDCSHGIIDWWNEGEAVADD